MDSPLISLENVLKAISTASEMRDPYVRRHQDRTAALCGKLGRAIGLGEEDLYYLDVAAHVHDIGKVMGIQGAITNKPGQLTEAEYLQMQFHPALGARILAPLGLDPRVVSAVLHHHEKWDGSGYPQELRGEEIPLFARIINICDTYDAIVTERVYRKTKTPAQALEVLQTYAYHFDPKLLKIFMEMDIESL